MVPQGWVRPGSVIAIAAVLALAGCARPAGVDGTLVDDWPAFPAAGVPAPVIGSCYDTSVRWVPHIDFNGRLSALDCGQVHSIETVHVGRFTGDTASRGTPPPRGSGPATAAFADCSKAATNYLGGDWHGLRIKVLYTAPSSRQWQGGARFYRCDAVMLEGPGDALGTWTGSMKGKGRDPAVLGYGCGTLESEGDEITGMRLDPCTWPHDTEYAGYFMARPGSYPTGKDQEAIGYSGCAKVVADFVGLSPGALEDRADLSYLYWLVSEEDWAAGDTSIRCWVTAYGGKKARASMKNLGNRPLPS